MVINISSWDKFKEEIDSEFILEHVIHGIDERMASLEEDILLVLGVRDLVFLDEDVLVDTLHGIHLLGVRILNKEDLTKRSLVDNFLDSKVFQSHFLLFLLAHTGSADQTCTWVAINDLLLCIQFLFFVILSEILLLNEYEVIKQVIVVSKDRFLTLFDLI